MSDLRLGRWQDVLADVDTVDSIITDPPYSARPHLGYRTAKGGDEGSIARRTGILSYAPLTEGDVVEFVDHWQRRSPRWWVIFADHITARWWHDLLAAADLYVFAPLPWVKRAAVPRFTGDGPASCTEWLVVARRRGIADGARPGSYCVGRVEGATNGSLMPGHKPLAGMRALVRDYSRPGDVVVDPFAGTGTTLVAAKVEGRQSCGAEVDPATFAIAKRRVLAPHTPELWGAS